MKLLRVSSNNVNPLTHRYLLDQAVLCRSLILPMKILVGIVVLEAHSTDTLEYPVSVLGCSTRSSYLPIDLEFLEDIEVL